MTSLSLIIPAAGSGVRLGTEVPKPFIEIDGKTILQHTIEKFIDIPGLRQVIVVASAQSVSLVEELISDYALPDLQFSVVEGGKERQNSIYNALKTVDQKTDLIAVHDAVRPFVETEQIMGCIEAANETGAAVLGVPVRDTIKKVNKEYFVESTPDRSVLWQIQTPQVFKREILIEAYEKAIKEGFTGTDDSSLVENTGVKVKVVEGGVNNFKITYPIDLKVTEQIIEDAS
ncbi:MAG: 2-C-methyl-D-erythritol 4-phosphate cytidylyltransferase [Gracilimonas sp.]|nr:2-C-methyl-D-erythritol 4-phosphate cytidylyltransferase [Gracilimonas sp.]